MGRNKTEAAKSGKPDRLSEKRLEFLLYPLLYAAGEPIDTSELINRIVKYVPLSPKDREANPSRNNEPKIAQITRNLISHQKREIKSFPSGYRFCKYDGVFHLQKGVSLKKNITSEEYKDIKDELFKVLMTAGPDLRIESDVFTEIAELEEKDRVRQFAGSDVIRTHNIPLDYKGLTRIMPFHLLSVNEEGEPICIFVEPFDGKIDADNFSKNLNTFISTRNFDGSFTKGNSYIYFINRHNTKDIHKVKAIELRKGAK